MSFHFGRKRNEESKTTAKRTANEIFVFVIDSLCFRQDFGVFPHGCLNRFKHPIMLVKINLTT